MGCLRTMRRLVTNLKRENKGPEMREFGLKKGLSERFGEIIICLEAGNP